MENDGDTGNPPATDPDPTIVVRLKLGWGFGTDTIELVIPDDKYGAEPAPTGTYSGPPLDLNFGPKPPIPPATDYGETDPSELGAGFGEVDPSALNLGDDIIL